MLHILINVKFQIFPFSKSLFFMNCENVFPAKISA
jgi:hypothetical protein